MEKTTTPEVLFLTKYNIELFELFSVIDYFVMDE